jgi:hypothetical protein
MAWLGWLNVWRIIVAGALLVTISPFITVQDKKEKHDAIV